MRFVDRMFIADDAEFESKHKRDEDGKFSSNGGTATPTAESLAKVREERYENQVKSFVEKRGLPYVTPSERNEKHLAVKMPEITEKESYSIYRYTDDLYEDMNSYFRNGSPVGEETLDHIRQIDRVMSQSRLDKAITVYRGVESVDGMFKGRIFQDKGYCSTSADTYQAQDFGNNILVLNLPRGLRAISTQGSSEYENESEILLDRNVRGTIKKLEKKGDYNLYYIDVELPDGK